MPSQQPQLEQSHFDHDQLQQQVQQTQQQQQQQQQQNQNPYQQAPLQAQGTAQPQQIQNQNPYQPQPQGFGSSLAPVLEQPGQGVSPLASSTGFGGAKNPFMHSANLPSAQGAQGNGVPAQGGLLAASGIGGMAQNPARSRDSLLVNSGWQVENGRHSPDAFSGLSARAR